MPPRSAKKAVAKKSSAQVKSPTPPPPTPSSEEKIQEMEVEKTVTEAEEEAIPLAAAEDGKDPMTTEIEEDAAVDPSLETPDAEKVPEVLVEGKGLDGGEEEMDARQGAEDELVEEETGVDEVEDTEGGVADGSGNGEDVDGANDGDKSRRDGEADNEENEWDDLSVYMQIPVMERKKQKEFEEIFIGGLDKEADENDLIKVFGEFGEIQSVRIVRRPSAKKNKGFAFIRYATVEHAKKALAEFKDGEVRGKQVRISASKDSDTLYLGNICKTWTSNQVIETLKGFGVEQIEEILLPDSPKNDGKSKGFALLEFSSHSDAMAAFQRLRKPDAVFGCDLSAKVTFAPTAMHSSEEDLLQVKTVYVEDLPASWDEEKVKELCKQYGEIKKVQLSRNSTTTKRKDFGLVEFTSRESAVACVEGTNTAQLGEGEIKVKANLAKPQNKGLAKRGARGGFKVKKDGEGTEEASQSKKDHPISKEVRGKEKSHPKLKNTEGSKPFKSQGKSTEGKHAAQAAQSVKGRKRGGRGTSNVISEQQSSKKARNNNKFGNARGRPSNSLGNQRATHFGKPQVNYATNAPTYASRYVAPETSYQAYAYAGSSGSKRHHSDLEPHAGYLPAAKQGRSSYGYEQRRAGGYVSQSSSYGYAGSASVPQTSYPEYSGYAGYKPGYAYPSSGAYAPRGAYY